MVLDCDQLDDRTYDVLLCDVQIPELNGFATTAEVTKIQERTGQHLPIIALTAHAMQNDIGSWKWMAIFQSRSIRASF